MELPKNITQIGETNPYCKIYVEDYVISYIKQLNQYARDKALAVGLYGVRKEEAGVTYLFLYGACKLNFLQRECRHLSQAVLQEVEKQRKKHFSEYVFLGYRLLDGEMVEGFHVCEQGVCRYIEGYAQFYEKNDSMLAFMVEERQEQAKPEEVDQEKYETVKKRQEERRAASDGKNARTFVLPWRGSRARGSVHEQTVQNAQRKAPMSQDVKLRRMKYSAAAVFALLCITGLAVMSNGEKAGELLAAAGHLIDDITAKQLPDAMEVSNGTVQVGSIVTEDKLTDAILKENAAAASAAATSGPSMPEITAQPSPQPTQQPTATPDSQPTEEPTKEPVQEPTREPVPEPVSYTIQKGDTLIGICIKKYGSDARVQEICTLNKIDNPDKIKEGDKILLP